MNTLFGSSAYVETEHFLSKTENALSLSELPAFLRVLLTTDGTVTKSLEAYFWEPVSVFSVSQGLQVLHFDAPNLNRKAGSTLISRRVELRGKTSCRIYASAESLICDERLPVKLKTELNAQRLGVGELLRECGLETYREILGVGQSERGDSVWRTYRIVMEHHPFIQITEHFPLAEYQ
jgi:chorismate-pyruvate lyase